MASAAKTAARFVGYIVAFVILLIVYWNLVIPGYFHNFKLCTTACHVTEVLDYHKITHPLWCVECHGFGVKSEILPGIPWHRVPSLEKAVEEHGECLMCHTLPGDFHKKHIEASGAVLAEFGLSRPVRCTDCHKLAYKGGHTFKPRADVCLKCHNPAKRHPYLLSSVASDCLVCHSDKPLVNWRLLKPGAESYSFAVTVGERIKSYLGFTWKVNSTCQLCHAMPMAPAHKVHVWRTYQAHVITCTDCHEPSAAHGSSPTVLVCTKCHKPSEIPFHELAAEKFSNCFMCHEGWLPGKGTLFMTGKGCKGCHGNTLRQSAMIGLHQVHVKYYDCSVCHNVNVKTHHEFEVSANTTSICLKCHTLAGGVKEDAIKLATYPVKIEFLGFSYHEVMVKYAKGNCFKCHYAWGHPKPPLVIPSSSSSS